MRYSMKVEASGLGRVYRRHEAFEDGGRTKRRRTETVALDSFDLTLEDGDRLGYVGMNGAGKSTTLKMIVGLLAPTAGMVRLDGLDPLKSRRRLSRRIGFLSPLKGQLWWDLPAIDTFRLVGAMYRLPARQWLADMEWLASELRFEHIGDAPLRSLSTGNRVKAELIATLLPRPDLIVLDEPTLGLDILAREGIRHAILSMHRAYGSTMIVTSHDLADVEQLCDRLMLIDRGRVLTSSTVDDMQRRYGRRRRVTLEHAPDAPLPTDLIALEPTNVTSTELTFDVLDGATVARLFAGAFADPRVVDVRVEGPGLSDIVADLYRGSDADR